jgi:hypothetical protein
MANQIVITFSIKLRCAETQKRRCLIQYVLAG